MKQYKITIEAVVECGTGKSAEKVAAKLVAGRNKKWFTDKNGKVEKVTVTPVDAINTVELDDEEEEV